MARAKSSKAKTTNGGAAATVGSNLPPEDDLARLATAAQDALTDNMVERLAVTGGNALEIVDRLNDEETRDAVHSVLTRLTDMHRTGALDTVFELVMLMHAVRNAATDNIVERLFAFVENMLNSVATEEMAELVETLQTSMHEALLEAKDTPAKGGMTQIYAMMKTPEGRRAITFIIKFVERMQINTLGEEAMKQAISKKK